MFWGWFYGRHPIPLLSSSRRWMWSLRRARNASVSSDIQLQDAHCPVLTPTLTLDSTSAVLIRDAFPILHLKQIPAPFCVWLLLLHTGTAAALAALFVPLLGVLCQERFCIVCCILRSTGSRRQSAYRKALNRDTTL